MHPHINRKQSKLNYMRLRWEKNERLVGNPENSQVWEMTKLMVFLVLF
ncbi:hypothetical protein F383_27111 [Gossypium arboreum]|uniref:Uncharacterized protein n=1 Tax=Gossypium arboreum TaxID=29729 RepID=A0A0B0PB53_GOSAR|nr:hypothetical protein F383_27111 [Gossypium arboreum]